MPDELINPLTDATPDAAYAKQATALSQSAADLAACAGDHTAPPEWPKTRAEIIATGRQLRQLKTEMRGTFKSWVEKFCPFSYRSAAAWMRASVREDEADEMLEPARCFIERFRPTRTASPTLDDDQLEGIALQLVLAVSLQLRRQAGIDDPPGITGALFAVAKSYPDLTFGELKRAVAMAKSDYIFSTVLLDALFGLATTQPADGVVASGDFIAALAEGVGDE